jgi:hypothetical protein
MNRQPGPRRPHRRHSISWIVIASALLLLLAANLSVLSPDMVLPLRSFITHPITIALALLGLGIATHILLPKAWRAEFGFIAEAIVVASTIGLFLEVPHIRSLYTPLQHSLDIAGQWDYQVTDAYGALTHGGKATIQQNQNGIFIDGYRLYNVPRGTTQIVRIPHGGTYWSTQMVALYGMPGMPVPQVHFIYTIRLPGGTPDAPAQAVRGYVVLTPKGDPISRLEGTYTHLAPGRLTGDIVFTLKSRAKRANHGG